ncbi:nuclear transport factor 2 family protein [Chitinophaga nivalis]|uniref:Nuclear transport factor 2 family protein n=1 Tax=Chitinophaga nivalis TaxID=2991709 RepID=A0ABT3ILI7_9BACT|nr:nuclear transport factor 2 family protein [Chitinophaga nivalis]MCW3465511.1 nuclear transport factor 2 family protein [Chitinophaga nivalis]MCW3484798.1 nuclear transport factor 2 family protein [Chitinophaga nivalis]
MRNYLCLLSMLVFAGCVQPGGKISLANANVHVVKELYEAFNAHDWTKAADCYADTAIFLAPGGSTDTLLQTRQQTIAGYQALQKTFPDIRHEVKEVYGERNHIIVEFIAEATGSDGSKWQRPMCSVFTVKEGKIKCDHTYSGNH